jgi:hypothetical protein
LVVISSKIIPLKKICLFAFITVFASQSNAQYFYKDFIVNQQLEAEQQLLQQNKIRNIDIKSFEDDGTESEGFFCEKEISKNYKKTEVFTRANMSKPSLLTTLFDDNNRIIKVVDSTLGMVRRIDFEYNNKLLQKITSVTKATDDDGLITYFSETRLFGYDADKLKNLTISKSGKKDVQVLFTTDETGKVTLEKNTATGVTYYYYYDDKNRLTDVVKPAANGKLKPDYMFEYNSSNQITQMTAVEDGSSNYFIWKYNYSNGLRTTEKCYSNERRMMGKVEYEYK